MSIKEIVGVETHCNFLYYNVSLNKLEYGNRIVVPAVLRRH